MPKEWLNIGIMGSRMDKDWIEVVSREACECGERDDIETRGFSSSESRWSGSDNKR